MNSTEQKIPKWFDGSVYNKGDEVTNPFSGETYYLNNIELSLYDFIMGCNQVWAIGIKPTKQQINHFDKALSWFKVNNVQAYMALLD
jgi:hypothetical protein